MATISQRISLEGGADIQRQLKALGDAGAAAFKQIQDAAAKPVVDPAQLDKTRQAMNNLAIAARQFGDEGAQATQQVTAGLKKTTEAAQQTGTSLISAATAFKVAAIGIAAGISALMSSLVTGLGETSKTISEQADKLRITAAQWEELRKRIAGAKLSNDDFVKSAGQASKIVGDAQKELLQLSKTYEVLKSDGSGAKTAVTVVTGSFGSLTKETAKAITELRSFGVSQKALQDPNPLVALRELASIIARMPNLAARAAAGTKFFGDNWKDTVKILADVNKELESDPLKKSRELSAAQVEAGNAARKAWEDFASAVRATKDQIGALFAAGSQAKAEWLTKLVDGSRELFKIWTGLSDAKAADFLAGLGDTAAEQTFKVLVAASQQLAGIWRDILLPAGRALLNVFSGIAAGIEGVTGSQVAAFFITATIAAIGLAIALKGIALVLSPIAALFSLAFSPLGIILIALGAAVVLFWDKFKTAANTALALLPQEVEQVRQAFATLFSGDFTGFWNQFSAAAISAFNRISAAALSVPWIKTLADGLAQIAIDFPATVALIAQGFIALGNAATTAANVINRLFGTELTGTDVAAVLILAQLTGGLQAMASAATIAGVAFTAFLGILALLATAIGGLPVIIGVLATALGAFIAYNWDAFKADAVAAWNAIKQGAIDAATAIGNFVSSIANIAWNTFSSLAVAAWDAITGAIGRAINAVLQFIGLKPSGGGGGGAAAVPGQAGGGLIAGRGTGTSDSNLAWLSRGEFVISAAAVRKFGAGVFAALNSGRVPGFADGGSIASIPIAGRSIDPANDLVNKMTNAFEQMTAAIKGQSQNIQELTQKIDELIITMNQFGSALVDKINSSTQWLGEKIDALGHDLGTRIAQALEEMRLHINSGQNRAGGGLLGGRGTGTSDSNLAWVSRGEHIMPARAVAQPGVLAFLEALRRSGGNLAHVLDGMGRFALGGMVRGPLPAFAAGGLAGGMSNVTIQFPGLPAIGGLRASSSVVDELHRAAALAQVRSGGRKPSRYS